MRSRASIALALFLSAATLQAQPGDPPSRAARVSGLQGIASLQASGVASWSEAALNYTVTTGDRIFTTKGSRLELEIGSMSARFNENADATVTNLTDGFMQLGLAQGTMRLAVYRLALGDSIEVDTPNGALVVSMPGSYRIDVPMNEHVTYVSVDNGRLEVLGPDVDQEVASGQAVQLSGTDHVRVLSIPRSPPTAFDQWSEERDRRVVASTCVRHMNRDIPGCTDMDEYGRWEANADYGDVWYPTHVRTDWVPYRDGRWVWVEPWGWSWMPDEPWGFAPFHYGRWARVGPAWGWIPGPVEVRPYYAPALVAFVGGAGWSVGVSIGSQAWFPLGPREAYYPSYNHGDRYLREVNVTNIRNVTNINTVIDVRNADRVNYVNRSAGMTAIPTDAFRQGRPVAREVLRVTPEDTRRGTIVSHPTAAPVEQAVLAGRPIAAPPVTARPVMITRRDQRGNSNIGNGAARGGDARGGDARGGDARGGDARGNDARDVGRGAGRGNAQQDNKRTVPPPVVTSTPPPAATTPPRPPQVQNKTGVAGVGEPQRERKTIITHTPPPPAKPPFKAQEPALKANPGRPLDPQQLEKVKSGKPAGPPKEPDKLRPPPTSPPVKPPTAAPPTKPPTGPPDKGKGRGGKPDSTKGRGGKPPADSTSGRGGRGRGNG